jgi:hypothetical protein
MSIVKNPVRVGGVNAVEPNSTLPMFRKFTTFEGSLVDEYIRVYYQEWLESNGVKLEQVTKCYLVKDVPEVSHVVPGDPNATPPTQDETVIDTPAYLPFSEGWYYKKVKATAQGLSIGGVVIAPLDYEINFGENMIVAVINMTLVAMPFDAKNEYQTQP